MNVFLLGYNTGGSPERHSYFIFHLLRKIPQISKIIYYKTQCCSQHNILISKIFQENKIDLIIQFDSNFKFDILPDYLKDIPKIHISEGEGPNYYVDILLALNEFESCIDESNINRVIYLPAPVGNNFYIINSIEERVNNPVFFGRFIPNKCPEKWLNKICEKFNCKIDVYSPETDYINKMKQYVNYKGYINDSKQMNEVINQYKYSIVISETESVCFFLKESILAGCLPIGIKEQIYGNFLRHMHLDHTFKIMGFIEDSDEELQRKLQLLHDKDISKFYQNLYSIERFMIEFLLVLRGLTLRDLKYDLNYENQNYEVIGEHSSSYYDINIIDWNKLKLNQ